MFSIFDVLRIFEALQIFFYKFLLQWGKNEEDFESSIFFETQKSYFAVDSRLIIYSNDHIHNAVLTLPNVVKINVENYKYVCKQSCLKFTNSILKKQRWFDVVERSKFQRWRTQRCFDVDLTLCNVTTSY